MTPRDVGWSLLLPALLAVLLAGGCRVQIVLSPSLPEVAGTVGTGTPVTQVFLSPSDRLNRLSLGAVLPPPAPGPDGPTLTGGATVEIRYAPEADPRFPQPAFHDWPAGQAWLGELAGDRVVGQSFVSPYPNLDGITLRAATFGADTGSGRGRLRDGPAVQVLALPIDGKPLTTLPGGTVVDIVGAAEGWAAVRLPSGESGYVDLADFAELPPPARTNDQDVILTLYREPDMVEVRRATLNAARIHDNSHVTFQFEPLPDSMDTRYRFTLASPRSRPGNAVSFRYDAGSSYVGGHRYEDGKPVEGALVFNPSYADGAPLYVGSLDDFGWSAQSGTLEGRFPAIEGTADRYLQVIVRGGSAPLQLTWSQLRPAGGVPMAVAQDPSAPAGGLVFNIGYAAEFPAAAAVRQSVERIAAMAGRDPGFFAVYSLLIMAVVGWWGWSRRRKAAHGRRLL